MADDSIPRDEAARREWIKYQLRLRGWSVGAVSRSLGLARQTARQVFDHPYPRVEKAIARLIGRKPQELWPERYDERGKPNRPMGRPKVSSHGGRHYAPSLRTRNRGAGGSR